jgi:hypothetical protein
MLLSRITSFKPTLKASELVHVSSILLSNCTANEQAGYVVLNFGASSFL